MTEMTRWLLLLKHKSGRNYPTKKKTIKGNPDKNVVIHHFEGVDYLPANIELSGTENSLVNTISREFVLKEAISAFRDTYDYILIDCMPSLGIPLSRLGSLRSCRAGTAGHGMI